MPRSKVNPTALSSCHKDRLDLLQSQARPHGPKAQTGLTGEDTLLRYVGNADPTGKKANRSSARRPRAVGSRYVKPSPVPWTVRVKIQGAG